MAREAPQLRRCVPCVSTALSLYALHGVNESCLGEIGPAELAIHKAVAEHEHTRAHRDQIAHILAETLGILQIDNAEDDAFHMKADGER